MSKLHNFVNILAWILMLGSGGLLGLRIWGAMHYSDLEKSLDSLRGVHKTFPVKWPGAIFILTLVWIIS